MKRTAAIDRRFWPIAAGALGLTATIAMALVLGNTIRRKLGV